VGRRLADLLHGRKRLQLSLLLAGPARLARHRLPRVAGSPVRRGVLGTSTSFSGKIVHDYSTVNFETLWNGDVYRKIVLRTVGIAAAVTVTRRAPGVSDRVLHGEDRHAAGPRPCWWSPCSCRCGPATS